MDDKSQTPGYNPHGHRHGNHYSHRYSGDNKWYPRVLYPQLIRRKWLSFLESSCWYNLDFGSHLPLDSRHSSKKTYTYTITETVGTEESSVNFPKPFHIAFKAISALFFIIIIATIIYSPSSALILAGPAGMALIAAKFFLTWNNTPK